MVQKMRQRDFAVLCGTRSSQTNRRHKFHFKPTNPFRVDLPLIWEEQERVSLCRTSNCMHVTGRWIRNTCAALSSTVNVLHAVLTINSDCLPQRHVHVRNRFLIVFHLTSNQEELLCTYTAKTAIFWDVTETDRHSVGTFRLHLSAKWSH